jgi:hypothetical protein
MRSFSSKSLASKSITALVAAIALGFASGAFTQTPGLSALVQSTAILQAQTGPDPAQQYRDMTRMLRNNDLASLLRVSIPAEKYAAIQAGYDAKRGLPINAANQKEFTESWGKLIAPNAVDLWMEQAEPKLAEARPQLAGALLMGMGALQMAVYSNDTEITESQREALQTALPNIQDWLNDTDFLSSASMREVATLITNAARRTGITRLEDFKALSFDQALAKADALLQAGKQSARIYGLDVDVILDSMRVQTLKNDGKNARIKTTITVFGANLDHEQDLVLENGRWYSKQMLTGKVKVQAEKQES